MLTLKELFKLIDYSTFFPAGEDAGDERRTHCFSPEHADTDPSLQVNLKTGQYRCLGCNIKGNALTYWTMFGGESGTGGTRQELFAKYGGSKEGKKENEPTSACSWDQVNKYRDDLLRIPGRYNYVTKVRGISPDIVMQRSIGFNGKRYTIPVVVDREIVNIRRYDPEATAKMKNMAGHGEGRLYNCDSIAGYDGVVVCEGEWDCLLLLSQGFNAVTSTSGASHWKIEWSVLLTGKKVYICYDVDNPGRMGANKVAQSVQKYAGSVHMVSLPLAESEYPGGDVSDYFMKAGYTAGDFRALLDASPQLGATTVIDDPDAEDVQFSQATKAQYVNRRIRFTATVSAKDTQPYAIPLKVQVACDMSQKGMCDACPVALKGNAGTMEFQYDRTDREILNALACSDVAQHAANKRQLGVPFKCPVVTFNTLESMNVEEIRLIPAIDGKSSTNMMDSNEYVVRRAYSIGHGIKTNAQYDMEGRTVAEPKQQYATHIIYQAKPSVDDLQHFTLRKDRVDDLHRTFGVGGGNIADRLATIYSDLEANVTRIYGRRDLHIMVDLVYHSPLFLPFQGRTIKGYVEALVLGDSGQGKSECSNTLMAHYGVGVKLDCKGATVAGLLGGVQETANRWFVSWGKIPLNDRRLVVLEEVKGADVEVLSKLTDMRSSGIAEVTKIEHQRTHARTRLLWLSNARAERQIAFYDYGVDAIRELFGNLEDIRRLDIAMCVGSGEVDSRLFNCRTADLPVAPHLATEALCRDLVLWCWSRTSNQIEFTPKAIDLILESAETLKRRYDSSIPLVEPADQRHKLARLSAALAGRLFSTVDGETLVINDQHVATVVAYMQRVYDAPYCRYHEYSGMHRLRNAPLPNEVFTKEFSNTPKPRALASGLFNSKTLTKQTISAFAGMSGQEGKEFGENFVGFLLRHNAVFNYYGKWKKEPPFTNWLRTASQTLPEVFNSGEGI